MTLPDIPWGREGALTKSDQEGWFSSPDGGPPNCPDSAPWAKDPRGVHKALEGSRRNEAASHAGRRRAELRTIKSLSRLLLVTVSETLEEILNLKHGYGH